MRQAALAAALAVALTACSHAPPEGAAKSGPAPGGTTAVTPEEGSPRFIGLVGIKAQHAPPFLGVPQTNFYCLRSFVDRQSGETRHQLYVSDSYSGGERVWNAARDGAGYPLRFIAVGRHQISCEGGCSYVEEFAAAIPESELRAHPQGFAVVFIAASGAEKRISVSGAQISAQLAALEQGRNLGQPTAAAAPATPQPHQ
jgi:hypothetical protein